MHSAPNANLYAQIEVAMPDDERVVLTTESGTPYRWRDLHEGSARYANLLLALGLEQGDRVAVQVEKSPQSLFLYLACLRTGLVYLPLNTAYRDTELAYFLGDAQPRAIVCVPEREGAVRSISEASVHTLDHAGAGTLSAAAAHQPHAFSTAEVRSDAPAAIIYTSGTTGRSKGAIVTHRNLVSNACTLVQIWGFSADDVLLHALPMFHIHGLFVANHCALLSGASLRWHRKFDANTVLRDLPHATVMMGVPTFYTRLLAEPDLSRALCERMRLFVSGSAPLLMETFHEFEARTGHRILERYGMSEAGMIASNPLHGERRAGTVGVPLPGVQVRVAGEGDRALSHGETGAIQIRGDNVFAGYWRMPEKTREEFTRDGWFRTGDVGTLDQQGYLSIVGRSKDLIITGGYNVYPKEIELALDAIPAVLESAVIGVPHADFGEAVTALVVPKEGCVPDEADIVQVLKRELASYKVPKRVLTLGELPRNAMGKVEKNVLRDRYARLYSARD